jgi:hypothetical protein
LVRVVAVDASLAVEIVVHDAFPEGGLSLGDAGGRWGGRRDALGLASLVKGEGDEKKAPSGNGIGEAADHHHLCSEGDSAFSTCWGSSSLDEDAVVSADDKEQDTTL